LFVGAATGQETGGCSQFDKISPGDFTIVIFGHCFFPPFFKYCSKKIADTLHKQAPVFIIKSMPFFGIGEVLHFFFIPG
jgi:hypothetical protein